MSKLSMHITDTHIHIYIYIYIYIYILGGGSRQAVKENPTSLISIRKVENFNKKNKQKRGTRHRILD